MSARRGPEDTVIVTLPGSVLAYHGVQFPADRGVRPNTEYEITVTRNMDYDGSGSTSIAYPWSLVQLLDPEQRIAWHEDLSPSLWQLIHQQIEAISSESL